MQVHHDTITIEREFAVSPAQLFAAYVDPSLREAWSTPSPTAEVRIDAAEVRTGGTERGRCGTKGDLRWTTEVSYLSVEADRHIIFTEVLKEGAQILTIALITFDFEEIADGGTKLLLTDQVTSLVGPDAIEGHREGYSQALENLESMTKGETENA